GGVSFDIATADDTASSSGGDYAASSLTGQTIPAGSSTFDFTVLVNGDTTPEANETFFVNVTNVTGATVADGQGAAVIINDDVATPTLASLTPATGTTAGGTSVVLTGADLTGATAVTFGGTAATSFTVDRATQITAITPAHAAGAVAVAVTTPGGTASAAGPFTHAAPAATDASLSGLTPGAGSLAPAVASATTSYAADVANTVASIALTPIASDAGATITVDGTAVASGAASAPIALAVGDTTIAIVVTAEDGITTQTYTIVVTRAVAAPALTSLAPATGPVTGGTSVVLTGADLTGATAVTFGGT